MALISVIIPAYNAESTLRETLDSVLNQTYSHLEVLVIDDGSQDATAEIVRAIADPRLQLFSYPNGGVSASRNRGIARATGEYLAFIDADDLWTPDKLEAQFKALQAHPEAAVAYSWTDYIDESGRYLRAGIHPTVQGDVSAALLLRFFLETCSNPLIRREALLRVGGFDESLVCAEDWDLCLRLAACYPFAAVLEPQVLYRQNLAGSSSSNTARMEADSLKTLERAFARAPKALKPLQRQSRAQLYKYLTFKSLRESGDRDRGWQAAKYFWQTLQNDRALLKQWRVVLSTLLRISVAIVSPALYRESLLKRSLLR